MKKILICTGYFYPHIGGLENYIYEISKRLASSENFSIDVLTTNVTCSIDIERIDKITIYRLPVWNCLDGTYPIPKPSITAFKQIDKISKNKYDLIITNTRFFTTTLIGVILSKLKKTQLLHIEHGAVHSVSQSDLISLLCKFYDHSVGYFIVRLSNKNIGVSMAACEFLKHIGAKDTSLLPNGVDINFFNCRETNLKKRLEIATEYKIITFIGRLIYQKGAHDLIQAFNELELLDVPLKLLIVGNGPYRDILESNSSDNENIMFLGEKHKNEIVEILNETDIFVNPSYSEGLPTSVLEAMSVGVPIIATDVGGTRELIINEKTGILIEPRNIPQLKQSIIRLIDDENLCADFSICAKEHVTEKYNWDHISKTFSAMLGT